MKLVLKTPGGGSAIGLALLLLAFTLKTPGQEITATIAGIVSDATCGVIPGAVIHIVDADMAERHISLLRKALLPGSRPTDRKSPSWQGLRFSTSWAGPSW